MKNIVPFFVVAARKMLPAGQPFWLTPSFWLSDDGGCWKQEKDLVRFDSHCFCFAACTLNKYFRPHKPNDITQYDAGSSHLYSPGSKSVSHHNYDSGRDD